MRKIDNQTYPLTLGIEEEYLLVDLDSYNLKVDPPEDFFKACQKRLKERVSHEFLRCQIEVGTSICTSLDEARDQLKELRQCIIEEAKAYHLAPIAASTHPFAAWEKLRHTNKERYNDLAQDMQIIAKRLMICGMHVHVGIDNEATRFDIFAQLRYFLPHLLALSTSSPFWQGFQTGLKSYRLSVFDEMPRTGLPAVFSSYGEYKRTIDVLIKAGQIEDASMIWWDLRPSAHFPTLEMRITDVCTHLEDSLAIAAVMRCLTRMLIRLKHSNQRWRSYPTFLLQENRWLAQKEGCKAQLIDFGQGEVIDFKDLCSELIKLLEEDAAALDCEKELYHIEIISKRGTSADEQIKIYQKAKDQGLSDKDAFKEVVRFLIQSTSHFS